MHLEMYHKYLNNFELIIQERDGDFIKSGVLRNNDLEYKIINYIPRFMEEGYCDSFSKQWTEFKYLQHDSKNDTSHSYNRIISNTKWDLSNMNGCLIECGCGPGRFTEIFVNTGVDVIAIDMSNAVDVNFVNCGKRNNLLIIQGDINSMPFFEKKFDYVFCYGVLQHTPDPRQTFKI